MSCPSEVHNSVKLYHYKTAMAFRLKRLLLSTVCFGVLFGVSAADSNPRLYTSDHDLLMEISKNDSFEILSVGDLPVNVTLYFHLSDASVLEPIPDLELEAGSGERSRSVNIQPRGRGHCTVTANSSAVNVSLSDLYMRVNVLETFGLGTFSTVVGWIYFVAWTVSFYPQIYTNWKRKSVIGLNFDFLALNLVGFTLYSCFNLGLYYSPVIQDMYYDDHPYGLIPVASNDVGFALHAICACIVTCFQCLIYDRGDQRVSRPTLGLLAVFAAVILVTAIVAAAGAVNWLWFLYVFSYIKLAITIVKYVPQAYLNYRRKSTEGWAIGNVLLDFTGGSLSILQMFIDAYNYNDWSSIFGNPTKFGLGLFSVLFDLLFIFQHYCLYSSSKSSESIAELGAVDERSKEERYQKF